METSGEFYLCKVPIGLFKMFSRWIWGIFNIQIHSDRGHKLMLFMFQNKDKDLLFFSKCFRDGFLPITK